MTDPIDPPDTLLGEWSRIVAATLAERGVSEVVISPGSRSTPFVVALASREDLTCFDVIDERCAAFVALGMARASGRPVALLCTSGTAAAHWYPAVIEASLSSIPLVLLTADRPFELAHCGAPQTIDQLKMFGDHVRAFVEIGAPDPSESALRGLRRTIAQAIAAAMHPVPGPVHVNLRARKPLEPREPSDARGHALRERALRVLAAPATNAARTVVAVDPVAIDEAARAIGAAKRPLIVVGPMPASALHDGARDAVLAIARATGAPVFAESASQLRFIGSARETIVALDALDLVLRDLVPCNAALTDEPDLVLQIGATPTSSALERFFAARPGLERIVVGIDRWTDAHGTARTMLIGDRASSLGALARSISSARSALDLGWCQRLRDADRRAWCAIDEELETGGFGEGTVARTVVAALPDRALLSIGNSLPIRSLDRFVAGGADLIVLSQRGANGIDGLVSGAIGASLATGAPGALVLGDISMQHDLGGLASARLLRAPLAIVVVQNGGGRIFEQLPVARALPWALPHFVTPQAIGFEHAAAAFGVAYECARGAHALRAALDRAMATDGVTLIEAIVPEHGAREADLRIDARIAGARS